LGSSGHRAVRSEPVASPRHGNGSCKGYRFRIVTVSTSKYAGKLRGDEIDDDSGNVAERMVRKSHGGISTHTLISDDRKMLTKEAEGFLEGTDDVAVFVGGTGVSHDDVTIETIRPFFEKELDGFGEMLREKSFHSIGGAAFLTRATAGVVRGKLIVCLPGSPDAVKTGLREALGVFPSVIKESRV